MQRLVGCMAALGHFISRSGERALPFFKIMKRTGTFQWTPEAAEAFENLKKYLTSPPIMVAPQSCEPLLLYLAATPQTASAVLVVEREEPVIAKEKNASPGRETSAEVTQQENLAEVPLQEENLAKQLQEENLDKYPASSPTTTNLVQHPVYFVSTVLRDARGCYPMQ